MVLEDLRSITIYDDTLNVSGVYTSLAAPAHSLASSPNPDSSHVERAPYTSTNTYAITIHSLEYTEQCKRQLLSADRTPVTSQTWLCPAHDLAPLPPSLGNMVNPLVARPSWFNSPATCAILPKGIQIGSTCGLHSVCHLLWSASMYKQLHSDESHILPPFPNRTEFEAIGLETCKGNSPGSLIQPGGQRQNA